jgi:hypothetical protein
MLDYLRQLDLLPRLVRRAFCHGQSGAMFVRQREEAERTLDRDLGRPAEAEKLAAALSLSLKRYRQLDRIARAAETRSRTQCQSSRPSSRSL